MKTNKIIIWSKFVHLLACSDFQEMQSHLEDPGSISVTQVFSLWAKVKSRVAKPTSSSTRGSSDQKPRLTTQEIPTNQPIAAASALYYGTSQRVDQIWPPSKTQDGLSDMENWQLKALASSLFFCHKSEQQKNTCLLLLFLVSSLTELYIYIYLQMLFFNFAKGSCIISQMGHSNYNTLLGIL